MPYITDDQAQSWLQVEKYNLADPDATPTEDQILHAVDEVLPRLSARYDVSGWIDAATTPDMVQRMIGMLVAAYVLRVAVGEDEGALDYASWLERRVYDLIKGLVDGSIDLPGVDPGVGNATGEGFPTDSSTDIFLDNPLDPQGSARAFDMQMRF